MSATLPTTNILPGGDGGLGSLNGVSRSNTPKLQAAFPGSPLGTAGLDADNIKAFYYAELAKVGDGPTNSNSLFADTPTLPFDGAPDFPGGVEEHVGPGGAPGNPWSPNVASAPDGNFSEMPAPPPQMADEIPSQNYGVGVGSQENPNESSDQQSRFTAGAINDSYALGQSPYVGQGALRN